MKKRVKSLWFQLLLVGVLLILVHKILNDGNAIALFFGRIFKILRPFFVGALIAALLYKPCSFLEKRFFHHPNLWIRRHATGFGVGVVYGVVGIVLWITVQVIWPAVFYNLESLAKSFPDYYTKALSFVEEYGVFSAFNLSEQLDPFVQQLFSAESVSRYVSYLSDMANSLFAVLTGLVVSVYILLERKPLLCVGKRLVSLMVRRTDRYTVFSHFKKLGNLFYSYFTGLGLDALIVGTLSVILFFAFRVPYAFLFGVFAGVCNLIPFFGPIVAAGVIFFFSFLSVGLGKALWILALQILLGQLDANVIQPKIIGHSVGISPFWVIFSVLVFGELWGVMGMIFGVPIVAVARFWFFELEEARYE